MAGKPAAIPGVLGGMAAMSIGGGALLSLGAGLLAGTAAMALRRIPLPPRLRGIGSTALVPALAALVTVSVLIVLIQPLIGDLTEWLHLKLAWWQFHNTVLMGLVLGLMTCSDFGGAISKTALAYAAVGVSGNDPSKFNTASMTIAAVVVAAGMAPALGMTLATLVRRSLFTDAERAYGKAAWLFGAAGLPEGAAPFALADPLRVLPASMAGGAVTGALVTTLGTTDSIPVGGFFSVADVGKPMLFVLAVTAGVVVTAGVAVALKSLRKAEVPVRARAARLRTRVAASG
jgi:PTS system fructose-specific IIC component